MAGSHSLALLTRMKHSGELLPREVQQLLAPFFPGFDLGRVRLHRGIPRYVLVAGAIKPIGYTDRYQIYLAPEAYRIDSAEGLALLAHEITHCRQYKEHGTWRFRAKYIAAYFQNRRRGLNAQAAYLNIPFEIEAREIETKVHTTMRLLHSRTRT